MDRRLEAGSKKDSMCRHKFSDTQCHRIYIRNTGTTCTILRAFQTKCLPVDKRSYLIAVIARHFLPQITTGMLRLTIKAVRHPTITNTLYVPMLVIQGPMAKTRAIDMTFRTKTTPVKESPIIWSVLVKTSISHDSHALTFVYESCRNVRARSPHPPIPAPVKPEPTALMVHGIPCQY